MVIIKFPNGNDWYKANWVFRRFSEDVVAAYPEESDLRLEIERAEGLSTMFLDHMEDSLLTKVMEAMRSVAQRTVKGEIPGWQRTHPNDTERQRMYVESITELLDLINKAAGRDRVNRA